MKGQARRKKLYRLEKGYRKWIKKKKTRREKNSGNAKDAINFKKKERKETWKKKMTEPGNEKET